MASVQFDNGKHTTKQAMSGNIPHDFRERENYSNLDIDKSRTYLNQQFGCQNGNEARQKLRERIDECDAVHPPKRIKADRKTSLEMHIPAPREDLSDEELRVFFEKAYSELEEFFGKENVIYGVTHFDEVHVYYDPHDKQKHVSRAGMHVVVVPFTDEMDFVPEKSKSGLNMNNFYRKNLPVDINKLLDSVCFDVFSFRYQDGSKTKNTETVEQLKAASAKLSKQKRKIEHNHNVIKKQIAEFTERKAELEEREKSLEADKASFEKEKEIWLEEQKKKMESELNEKKLKLVKAYRAYKLRQTQRLKEKYEKRMLEFKKLLRAKYKERLNRDLKRQVKDINAYKAWLHKTRVSAAQTELNVSDITNEITCEKE